MECFIIEDFNDESFNKQKGERCYEKTNSSMSSPDLINFPTSGFCTGIRVGIKRQNNN